MEYHPAPARGKGSNPEVAFGIMKKLLFAAVLCAAPALAQSPSPAASPAPFPHQELVLELLRVDRSANFLVQKGIDVHADPPLTNEQVKECEAFFGSLANGSLGDTETTIKEFNKKYGKLLGLPDGDDGISRMHKFREFTCAEGKWVQYCPQMDGLDYVSALMTYVFRQNGQLCAVLGRYRAPQGPVGGSLTREQAISKAQERIKKDFPFDEVNVTGPVKIAECLVDDVDKLPGLQKLITVALDVGTPSKVKRVIFVAGEPKWVEDGSYRGCTGKIFKQDPVTDAETLTKMDLVDIEHPGSFWKSYVINGKNIKVDAPGALDRASAFFGGFSEDPFDPDPSDKFAEINAYYHLTQGWAKMTEAGAPTEEELRPFTPLYFNHWAWADCEGWAPSEEEPDGPDKTAKQNAYDECVAMQTANAWFSPTTHMLNFAADNFGVVRTTVDGRDTYKHTAYEATVIVHELGHWIHYILSPHHSLTGNYGTNCEAQATTESVADLFAAIVCKNPVIGSYYLGSKKRDLGTLIKYSQVLPLSYQHVPAGQPGKEFHDAGLAFGSAYWKIVSDLGEAKALKLMLHAMRVCHMPCKFQNMALAALAMDQMLSSSPRGKSMADRFKANELIQGYLAFP